MSIPNLTSNQYKQLLFQMLRRLFQRQNHTDGTKLLYECGDILSNDSVVIDQPDFDALESHYSSEVKYCHTKGITDMGAYYDDENFDANWAKWQDIMATIGIDLEMTYSAGYPSKVIFTLPDQTQKTLNAGGFQYWTINTTQGSDLEYATLSFPYRYKYDLSNVPELTVDDYQRVGTRCRWTYDENKSQITITGAGALPSSLSSIFSNIFNKKINTIVIGAGVTKIGSSMASSVYVSNIVFLHGKNQDIELPGGLIDSGTESSPTSYTIYTDNEQVKNYSYPTSYTTVTIKPLSEWQG